MSEPRTVTATWTTTRRVGIADVASMRDIAGCRNADPLYNYPEGSLLCLGFNGELVDVDSLRCRIIARFQILDDEPPLPYWDRAPMRSLIPSRAVWSDPE